VTGRRRTSFQIETNTDVVNISLLKKYGRYRGDDAAKKKKKTLRDL